MMKSLYLLLFTLFIASCSGDPSFTLDGRLTDSDEVYIYLDRRDNGEWVSTDSAIVVDGEFQFEGKVEYPTAYYLRIKSKRGYKMLFLENQNIAVSGSADSLYSLQVTGSATNYEYDLFSDTIELLLNEKIHLFARQQQALVDSENDIISQLETESKLIDKKVVDWKIKFLIENRDSYATPLVLQSLTTEIEPATLDSLINGLDQSIVNTDIVVNLKDYIQKRRVLIPGNIAPDFVLPNRDGSLVSLSDITGEGPVLLFFWASWCANCTETSDILEELFTEYSNRGFKIVAVSLDSMKDDWIGSISEGKGEWIHLSDLKFWNNKAAQLYGINRIPESYLLDSTGNIIGSNLSPDELYDIVRTLIDN